MGMSGRWKEEANEKKQLRNSKEMLSLLQMGPFHLKKKHLRNNFNFKYF